ncbi:MAG: cysteine desulfurase NifS [Blastocatellia bacterium]|nr:cysteine desulfurase NifS [Blastocatellia bacterium]
MTENTLTSRVYLDNSASTKLAAEVLEAMLPYFSEQFGNASSIHRFGQQAKAAMDNARQQVADLIGAQANEIIFLSGGTEADNLAIRGITSNYQGKGNHIITSQFEHPAVRNTCAALEKEGWRVTYLPIYRNGLVRIEDVKAAISDETLLITIMHANNEVGTLQPIAEIGELVKEIRNQRKNIFFHTDAVQSVGKIVVNVKDLGVDLLSLSGHKIHGPKGIGALYLRKGVRISSQITGGRHERDRRAGTENVPAIVGLGCAAKLAEHHLAEEMEKISHLRDYFETEVSKLVPEIKFNGETSSRLPNISNISFSYIEGEALLIALDLKGVAVSTGSACSSGSTEPSPVLVAMGLSKELVRGSIRFSLSRYTTKEEIDYVLSILPEAVTRLRRVSPLYRQAMSTKQ